MYFHLFVHVQGIGFGYGGVNPGAQFPHGPLRLGPDTTNALPDVGYRHFSGYNYLDTKVRMFSHTHFVGAGINGLGNLGVMPVRLRSDDDNEEENMPLQKWVYREEEGEEGDTFNTLVWWSKFNKEMETALPGRYDVYLDTPAVEVSLLATGTLTAIHQYHYTPTTTSPDKSRTPEGGAGGGGYTPAVVMDICHAAQVSPGVTRIRNSNCHNASLTLAADGQSFTASLLGDKNIWMYFYGEFASAEGGASMKAKHWTVCSNADKGADDDSSSDFSCDTNTLNGSSDNGILFSRVSFGHVDGQESAGVQLRMGLSFISTEMAHNNYLEDFPPNTNTNDFQERSEQTSQKWCDALDFLTVTPLAGDVDLEAMLYSANYRAQMTPTIYTEAGGLYLGLDKTVHNATQERLEIYGTREGQGSEKLFEFYSDLSFWDTFRGAHPWFLLTDESLAVGVLRSVSEMTQQQNAFPRWVLASTDISCMVGLHGGEWREEGREGVVVKVRYMLFPYVVLLWFSLLCFTYYITKLMFLSPHPSSLPPSLPPRLRSTGGGGGREWTGCGVRPEGCAGDASAHGSGGVAQERQDRSGLLPGAWICVQRG